jgi:hypothetical protein
MQVQELIDALLPEKPGLGTSSALSSSSSFRASRHEENQNDNVNVGADASQNSSRLPRRIIEQELKLFESDKARGRTGGRHIYNSKQDQENIVNAIRSRAKLAVIEQKREALADDNTFFALAKHFTDANMTIMNYDDFKSQARTAPSSLKRFFTAANFMMFPRNSHGYISCDDFLRYAGMSTSDCALLLLLDVQICATFNRRRKHVCPAFRELS